MKEHNDHNVETINMQEIWDKVQSLKEISDQSGAEQTPTTEVKI